MAFRDYCLNISFEKAVQEVQDLYEIEYRQLSDTEIDEKPLISRLIASETADKKFVAKCKRLVIEGIFNTIMLGLYLLFLLFITVMLFVLFADKILWVVILGIICLDIIVFFIISKICFEIRKIKQLRAGIPKHKVYYLEDCSIEAITATLGHTVHFKKCSHDTTAPSIYIITRLFDRPLVINAEDCEVKDEEDTPKQD